MDQKKPSYERPMLIKFKADVAEGVPPCQGGTSAGGFCRTGGSANDRCRAGNSPTQDCSGGTTPFAS